MRVFNNLFLLNARVLQDRNGENLSAPFLANCADIEVDVGRI